MIYNFKNFFKTYDPIHNSEYITNGHWIIKKSALRKIHLNYVNSFPEQDQKIKSIMPMLEQQEQKEIVSDFEPEWFIPGEEYNTLLGNNNAIQEEYFSFITDLNCKTCICENENKKPLSIYQWQNGQYIFVGLLLPLNPNSANKQKTISYAERMEQLKQKQEQKEQRKENMRKCLYISDNRAVVRNKELVSVADLIKDEEYKNVYIEENKKDYGEIFIDLGIICMGTGRTIDKNKDDSSYTRQNLQNIKNITLEGYKNYITECLNNNQFINIAEIKLMELAGENTEELIQYRRDWYNRKEQEEQEKQKQREQKERQFVEQENNKVAEKILQVERAILDGQKVRNEEITIYKSKYEYKTTSIILHMMKEYNINIPLKTQGWINEALFSITGTDYTYYTTSADSKTFYKYLQQLIDKINSKERRVTA